MTDAATTWNDVPHLAPGTYLSPVVDEIDATGLPVEPRGVPAGFDGSWNGD